MSLIRDYVAHSLIGTPFEPPIRGIRRAAQFAQRIRHPELREVHLESSRIELVLRRAVSESSNCVDVGCHLGSVLDRFVRYAPRGRHIAVEPVPHKARWLRRKFPGVTVVEAALGSEEGRADLYVDARRSGVESLRPHDGAEMRGACVDVRTLDMVVPPEREVGFLKLDVEGGECDVILGAERVLTKSRPTVLFECAASHLEAFSRTPGDVFRLFTEHHGYSVHHLKDWLSGGSPLDLQAFEKALLYPFEAFNFLATPAEAVRIDG